MQMRIADSMWMRRALLLAALGGTLAVGTTALAAPPASSAPGSAPEIDWFTMAMGFIAGLALFLYGVQILADTLKELGGGQFQRLLYRSSRNRVTALGAGTVATVALDSSSVTIILLIALVDSGLIAFASSLPMILGANIGTTISSQLFAWSIDEFAPIPMAIGLLGWTISKDEDRQRGFLVVFAIGLILFALSTIGSAAEPLKESPQIVAWLETLEAPLLGVLAGAIVTVAIQSSSAMMGIVIVLASGGLISLPAGLAMMLGAEIGTVADTLIASIGRSRAAVRAGLFHLGFNIISVSIGLLLLGPLTAFAMWSATDTGQQLANAHVLFNIAGALLMLPFVGVAARLLERLVPRGASDDEAERKAAAPEERSEVDLPTPKTA